MAIRSLILLSLLLFAHFSSSYTLGEDDGLDEDLSFLLEDDAAYGISFLPDEYQFVDPDSLYEESDDEYEDPDDSGTGGNVGSSGESYATPEVDETDVVVLLERNFTTVVENNRHVMVEFYAPWCGHCQALAPEYAAAATELRDEEVVLAKVDATEENELAHEYNVNGFPTVLFFVNGEYRSYPGQRTKDAIVTWIKKNIGPGIHNITTVKDAEKILTSENKVVLGFIDSLEGPDNRELAAASRLEDEVNFYQTENADVAQLFHIDPKVKRPALVMLKKEAEKLSYFDGKFEKSVIAEFVFSNKLPLVTFFTKEAAPSIFESSIKKQLLLFATSKKSNRFVPIFQEAAKFFKGRLIFVFVEMDTEVGKPVADYFGVSRKTASVLAYTRDGGKKFVFDGKVTLDEIKAFGEDFVEDKLKPFYKSDPIPATNDGDVKIVVGNNFDEIVLDETKDVLLEVYAPWCSRCQGLEPTYNKLAKHLREIKSIVIAKMNGITNEHARAKADGFPAILFYPAGNKSLDPITFDMDRTAVGFYKFLKKYASIPFKLQKPASKVSSSNMEGGNESSDDPKDEL